jgi:hypothetical protein
MTLTGPIALNTWTDAALLDLQAAIRAELARRAALYGTPTERA